MIRCQYGFVGKKGKKLDAREEMQEGMSNY
jgi:hypothetical protein